VQASGLLVDHGQAESLHRNFDRPFVHPGLPRNRPDATPTLYRSWPGSTRTWPARCATQVDLYGSGL